MFSVSATLASLGKSEVANVGYKYSFCNTCLAELSHKVAYSTGSAHNNVFALYVGAVACVCTDSRWLNHSTIVETHSLWQLHYTVVVDNKEVLCAAISLESLNTQMLAYVVLSALARVALATNKLRTSRDVVARLAYCNFAAACHNNSRILMSLNNGIECGRV